MRTRWQCSLAATLSFSMIFIVSVPGAAVRELVHLTSLPDASQFTQESILEATVTLWSLIKAKQNAELAGLRAIHIVLVVEEPDLEANLTHPVLLQSADWLHHIIVTGIPRRSAWSIATQEHPSLAEEVPDSMHEQDLVKSVKAFRDMLNLGSTLFPNADTYVVTSPGIAFFDDTYQWITELEPLPLSVHGAHSHCSRRLSFPCANLANSMEKAGIKRLTEENMNAFVQEAYTWPQDHPEHGTFVIPAAILQCMLERMPPVFVGTSPFAHSVLHVMHQCMCAANHSGVLHASRQKGRTFHLGPALQEEESTLHLPSELRPSTALRWLNTEIAVRSKFLGRQQVQEPFGFDWPEPDSALPATRACGQVVPQAVPEAIPQATRSRLPEESSRGRALLQAENNTEERAVEGGAMGLEGGGAAEEADGGEGVRFVLVLGAEGAGHEEVHRLYADMRPAGARVLGQAKASLLVRLQLALFGSGADGKGNPGLWDWPCHARRVGEGGRGEVVQEVVQALQDVERAARESLGVGGVGKEVVVPLNSAGLKSAAHRRKVGFGSYPNVEGGPCRALAYPDVDATAAACAAAGVQCSFLVLLREPTAMLSAGLRGQARGGSEQHERVRVLHSMLSVLHTQVEANRNMSHWCWEHGSRRVEPLAAALGLEVAATRKWLAEAGAEDGAGASEEEASVLHGMPPWELQAVTSAARQLYAACGKELKEQDITTSRRGRKFGRERESEEEEGGRERRRKRKAEAEREPGDGRAGSAQAGGGRGVRGGGGSQAAEMEGFVSDVTGALGGEALGETQGARRAQYRALGAELEEALRAAPSKVFEKRALPCGAPGQPEGQSTRNLKPGPEGLIFVKLRKCASSTNAGVAYRIAQRHAPPNASSCAVHAGHRWGVRYQGRAAGRSFMWSFVREPSARALSEVFHLQVSREQVAPTDGNLLPLLQKMSNMQVMILSPRQPLASSERFRAMARGPGASGPRPRLEWPFAELRADVAAVLDAYDFVGVVERQDESLVVLKLLLGLDFGDLLHVSSKVQGGYDDLCVQITPTFRSPKVARFLQTSRWRLTQAGDLLLHAAVNRSLDATIDALGRGVVEQELQRFRELNARAQAACAGRVAFPCSPDGRPQASAQADCFVGDNGCGRRCLDEFAATMLD